MDESIVREFEQQQVGKLKLSKIVRECGYGDPRNHDQCVLGKAYRHVTGKSLALTGDSALMTFQTPVGINPYFSHAASAARTFGIPTSVAVQAEIMCMRGRSAADIADWLESQGL